MFLTSWSDTVTLQVVGECRIAPLSLTSLNRSKFRRLELAIWFIPSLINGHNPVMGTFTDFLLGPMFPIVTDIMRKLIRDLGGW